MFGPRDPALGSGLALAEPASGAALSHDQLRDAIAAESARLNRFTGGAKALVLIALAPSLAPVLTHLAALAAGHAALPIPPELDDQRLGRLLALYRPELVARPLLAPDAGYEPVAPGLWRRAGPEAEAPLHPDLALLLSTSGSTGSPRMVRLSRAAVAANAAQIVAALGLTSAERAPTALPLSYSYGLSVLHSHLAAGAAVILTGEGLTGRGFWQVLAESGATSFAGVPQSYAMLRRLDLDRLAPPGLTTLTQAGGAMPPDLIAHFHALARRRDGRMFVMYGQTEATARIAVLPAEELADNLGAAGRALPDGTLSTDRDGRILYHGPNVMMGYGADRADLARGDELGGRLETGDLGRLDASGMLWITGREKRIAKLDGRRFNLDEIEAAAAAFAPAAVLERAERLVVVLAATALPAPEERTAFAQDLGLHSSQLRWRLVETLPLTGRGKLDYAALAEEGA